ncbi:MAG TPA: class I adenylate-forming enzyme family protein [bacterium]|nr:class I adenylate-forming enzyme family protein [bacterium]
MPFTPIPLSKRFRGLLLRHRRREFTMANVIDLLAEVYDGREIIIVEEPVEYAFLTTTRLTYPNVLEIINRMGNALKDAGVAPGDRVAVYTRNRPELALASLAAMKIGAAAVPLNHQLKRDEVCVILEDAAPAAFITDRSTFDPAFGSPAGFPAPARLLLHEHPADTPAGSDSFKAMMEAASPALAPFPMVPDRIAGIFYTSGTTGAARGARMTSRNLISNNIGLPALFKGLAPHEEEMLGMMMQPLSHIMGFALFLMRFAIGAPHVVLERFHPVRALEAISKYRVTSVTGVPAMFVMMVEAGAENYDLSSVRLWTSGSDEMPVEYRKKLQAMGSRVTKKGERRPAAFLEGYGQAETSPISTFCLHLQKFDPGPGCIGWRVPGVKLKVADEHGVEVKKGAVGELLVKGDHVMPGYWRRGQEESAEIFTPDGWFKTGDLVRRGKYGLYYLVDRKKDVIKHGGFSVFCKEVEEEIMENPKVFEAALVGMKDAVKGQVPVAFVTLEKGAEATEDELLEWCRAHLADYKAPRRIIIIEHMPRNPTMKIDKKALRARLMEIMSSQ